jgi:hypothetical protein
MDLSQAIRWTGSAAVAVACMGIATSNAVMSLSACVLWGATLIAAAVRARP